MVFDPESSLDTSPNPYGGLSVGFGFAGMYFDELSRGIEDGIGTQVGKEFVSFSQRYMRDVAHEEGDFPKDAGLANAFRMALGQTFGYEVRSVSELKTGLEMLADDFENLNNLSASSLRILADFCKHAGDELADKEDEFRVNYAAQAS